MNQQKRVQIFAKLAQTIKNPTTELEYQNPFELLIAVILSAQATDVSVNRATRKLYKVANDPESILKLGEERLKKYIKTIGLYNAKAGNIIKTCRIIIDKHQGKVPDNRESLQTLPGVGRKTANVLLNTAFGQPAIAVDTHIFRLGNRTGIAPGDNVLEVEKKLLKWVPNKYKKDAHHLLILHGRYICTARKPKCRQCVINKLCEFEDKAKYA